MTIARASALIAQIRRDPAWQEEIAALGDDPNLEDVLAGAARRGIAITREDLLAAFHRDWALRLLALRPNG